MILFSLVVAAANLVLPAFGQAADSMQEASASLSLHLHPGTASAPLPEGYDTTSATVALELDFPGKAEVDIRSENGWMSVCALEIDLQLPQDAPPDIQALLCWVDADHHWFQNLSPARLRSGETTLVRFDLSVAAAGWEPRGHFGAWHRLARLAPQRTGLRLFSGSTFRGTGIVANVRAVACRPGVESAPVIRRIRVLTPESTVYERYELAVTLDDRYDNPFDPEEVNLTAAVEDPDGFTNTVAGFYYQGYHRQRGADRDRIIPQGPPHWRLRYTPVKPGPHRMTLRVSDPAGTGYSDPVLFSADPPRHPGFVRVAESDPRFFEFDDGSPFLPIGHNIRSPSDARVNQQFPWAIRHSETSAAYERYFGDMQSHGENITEIWMASWSLGIEWSRGAPGYHGPGRYNLMHAWELDRVVEEAERRGIFINLTIHNHGQFSTHWDPEWQFNPFNSALGGYLESPEDYFDNPRAMAAFEQRMRYIVARWGYSPHIFSWKLWNELDLTGSRRERVNYLRPEVVEWHRDAGRRIRAMDHYGHLISTHFCNDYTHQNADIVGLPEIDLALVDAYHSNRDPLHIVDLMRRTAEFNSRFEKPVLITEFGGSPYAATLEHIESALHAGLWSSVAIPLGGAPMLWWWTLIEEQNHYPKFRALANFMQGEDRRNPAATLRRLKVVGGDSAPETASACQAWFFSDGRDGTGWLFDAGAFTHRHPRKLTGLDLEFNDMEEGRFQIEYWNTVKGVPVHSSKGLSRNRNLKVAVPEFRRDLAFKVRWRDKDNPTP